MEAPQAFMYASEPQAVPTKRSRPKYREDESLPNDPHEIDRLCERLFSNDGFDEIAIAWKRISKYEREVHGGDWPKAD